MIYRVLIPFLLKIIYFRSKYDYDKCDRIRIKMFKLLFLTMVKSQYLVNTLEYVEAEMTAWLNGQQSSGMLKPLLAEAVDETIYSWFDDGVLSRNEIAGILKKEKNAHLASVFIVFNVFPSFVFHSTLPFVLAPQTKLDAPDGVEKRTSSVKALLPSTIVPFNFF